jgi:transcriptional regulator with XRE-family HTH domain
MHLHAYQDSSMNQFPDPSKAAASARLTEPAVAPETPEQRVARLYASPGGPLVGWLHDECRRRGQTCYQMAEALGVTYGYISQLRSGRRLTRHISDQFATACARYLGVPPVVVKIAAGRIPLSDFVSPYEPLEAALDRAVMRMLDDPVARHLLPADPTTLSLQAKQALVAMYTEGTGHDVLGLRQLPETVRWLQRAAVIHDESCSEAMRGHRDVMHRH